jgi:hypothetical protein
MPCVLEVGDIYPYPQPAQDNVRSSFVLHFSKKSPMLGIYCCTVSYLLTKAGWKLLSKGGEVVQVARNSTVFQLPRELPGKLTFHDPLSSYLEIVVELPKMIAPEQRVSLFNKIHITFSAAIKRAMQTLHYEVKTPELSFLCPEQSARCSTFPHVARVNATHSFLTCSVSPDSVVHPLTPDQEMWLDGVEAKGKNRQQKKATSASTSAKSKSDSKKKSTSVPPLSVSGERPTLTELVKIRLPSRVGPKSLVFGTLLLQHDFGDKVANISECCRGDPERITMGILREWLAGKGVEVSWESLIATLKNCELSLMAEQIQMALEQLPS